MSGQRGSRRHRRSVQGLRGDFRKVRNMKRRLSDERSGRTLDPCPVCDSRPAARKDCPECGEQ